MLVTMDKGKAKIVPGKLADFLPEELMDDFGYVWRKELREHTLEFVGYNGDEEMGAIILAFDNSPEAAIRVEETNWARERADIIFPGEITLNLFMEIIRQEYEVYGNGRKNKL